MARIIEFHIPVDLKPKIKWVPWEERGRLVVIPSNLKKGAEIGQLLIEKGLSK